MSKNDTTPHADGSMEQVRELLFGAQMKEMELRLQRQEEKLQRDMGDTGNALKTRLDFLEDFMKSEISSVLGRIAAEKSERESALKDARRDLDEATKAEQRERKEALASLAKELASVNETLERKLTSLSNTLDATERELRELLLRENTTLATRVEERYQQALDALKSSAGQIRQDMVHRNALAGMFTETALKLSGQFVADAAENQVASDVSAEGGENA